VGLQARRRSLVRLQTHRVVARASLALGTLDRQECPGTPEAHSESIRLPPKKKRLSIASIDRTMETMNASEFSKKAIHSLLQCLLAVVVVMSTTAPLKALVPNVDCTPEPATSYVSGQAENIMIVHFAGKPVAQKIVDPLYVMVMAAHADGIDLKLSSGFRTNAQQKYLYDCYVNCNCNNCNLAAKPGYSNHQSGHAVDITTNCSLGWSNDYCASVSPPFAWLMKNANTYGFKKTVKSEPWHWEWWEGGPGGGICLEDCEEGCLPPSEESIDPLQKMNVGWIGGPCTSDDACSPNGGFCFPQAEGFAQGLCSEPCDKYCPDTPGASVTFCVDKDELVVDSPDGACVAKCDKSKSPSGCRPGYACKVVPRYNDPETTASVCLPEAGGEKAISPKGWSIGISSANCSFSRCALEKGEVCAKTTANDSGCVNALCLDPESQVINEGLSCSFLYSPYGTAVECSSKGIAMSEIPCSVDAPCNACGTCGPLPIETCDGVDNNCDGSIDEGLLNACGSCGDVPDELCDGIDNDCDGEIDEGLLNACGSCGDVPDELCDGIDNDCDGETDEGCPNEEAEPTPDTLEPMDGQHAEAWTSPDNPSNQGPDAPRTQDPTLEKSTNDGTQAGCQASSGVPRSSPWLLALLSLLALLFLRRRKNAS